jgi:hypothetical protein
MSPGGRRSVLPSHPHFLCRISNSIGFCLALAHSNTSGWRTLKKNRNPNFRFEKGRKENKNYVRFPFSVQWTDYTAFKPTIAQVTTHNLLSQHDLPLTCFGFYMTILTEFQKQEYLLDNSLSMALWRLKHAPGTI